MSTSITSSSGNEQKAETLCGTPSRSRWYRASSRKTASSTRTSLPSLKGNTALKASNTAVSSNATPRVESRTTP
eukprot:1832733-Rhodomonas_salina.1